MFYICVVLYIQNAPGAVAFLSLLVVSLVKDRIEENANTREQSLLRGCRILRKVQVQDHGIRKNFRHGRLGSLEKDSQVWILAARVRVGGRVNPVGGLAASPSAGISLGAAIDAASPAAGRRVDHIEIVSGGV